MKRSNLGLSFLIIFVLFNSLNISFAQPQSLKICSFNIQFLGNSPVRDNKALAELVKDCEIVVVQELVSPPFPGKFPDNSPFNPDPDSAKFFDEMDSLGFKFLLSEEDTGTGDIIHRNGSSTEWWVAFFKPESVLLANDLPSGFLAEDRSNHDDYERVPYAFAFRSIAGGVDFVLVSVHLKPGKETSSKKRRKHELAAIAEWINDNNDIEKDFIVLGDMNIENCNELANTTPAGFQSLNDECLPTNTNIRVPKPYDHVMYNATDTINEIDFEFGFKVVNLVVGMKSAWQASSSDPYPGNPYNHNEFRKHYSDHHPVVFNLLVPLEGDDD